VPRHVPLSDTFHDISNNLIDEEEEEDEKKDKKKFFTKNLNFRGKLFNTPSRPQEQAVKSVMQHLISTKGGIMILPPGSGKTNMAIYMAVNLVRGGMKTLVLAHSDFLLCQWKARIEQFVDGDVKIGLLQQDSCIYENCDFVLGSLQSIHARDYPKAALVYGLVIVDECHHIAASTFFHAMSKLTYVYSLGLTATPTRNDGLTKVLEYTLGPVAFRSLAPQNNQVQVNMITYTLGKETEIIYKNKVIGISSMLTNLTKDRLRNSVITSLISLMYKTYPNRKGLLLSDRVDHLKELYRNMDQSMCSIITGNIHTEISTKERSKRKRDRQELTFDKYLTMSTYKLFEEAVDFDGDFIILATPKVRVEQCTGRILRGRNTSIRPLIIDLVDPFSSFARWAKTREGFYAKNGYEVLQILEKQIIQQASVLALR
jgi:superfamily II DNA or RNA helicase